MTTNDRLILRAIRTADKVRIVLDFDGEGPMLINVTDSQFRRDFERIYKEMIYRNTEMMQYDTSTNN